MQEGVSIRRFMETFLDDTQVMSGKIALRNVPIRNMIVCEHCSTPCPPRFLQQCGFSGTMRPWLARRKSESKILARGWSFTGALSLQVCPRSRSWFVRSVGQDLHQFVDDLAVETSPHLGKRFLTSGPWEPTNRIVIVRPIGVINFKKVSGFTNATQVSTFVKFLEFFGIRFSDVFLWLERAN